MCTLATAIQTVIKDDVADEGKSLVRLNVNAVARYKSQETLEKRATTFLLLKERDELFLFFFSFFRSSSSSAAAAAIR